VTSKDIDKAKLIALRLLKYRIRSQKELETRLKARKVSKETIRIVLKDLRHLGLVDDRKFCRVWIRDRIRRFFGPAKIKSELRQKGIDPEIISQYTREYAQEIESLDTIQRLIRRRRRRYRGRDFEVKRKLFNYLRGRGFSLDTITVALQDERGVDDD
jgi:regulatory protein